MAVPTNLQGNGLSGMVGEAFRQAAQARGILVSNALTPDFDCDVFCHFAARHPYHTDQQILASNVALSADVLGKIEPHTRLIFLSSNSVYEGCSGEVTEEQNVQPQSMYGVSKYSVEQLIRTAHPNHIILRLPAILGYRPSQHLLARWLCSAQQNQPITMLYPDAIFNNFIMLDSLTQILIRLVVRPDIPAGTYNVATRSTLTFTEVFEKVMTALVNKPQMLVRSSSVGPFRINIDKAMNEFSDCLTVDDDNLTTWAKGYFSQVLDGKGGTR